jgi:hypothetical protein
MICNIPFYVNIIALDKNINIGFNLQKIDEHVENFINIC